MLRSVRQVLAAPELNEIAHNVECSPRFEQRERFVGGRHACDLVVLERSSNDAADGSSSTTKIEAPAVCFE
jgi:hypothetical protein